MTCMTAKDSDQGLLDLYGFYAPGKITKRALPDCAGRSAVGGYPGNDADGRALQATGDRMGKAGSVGFCYGGGIVNARAVACPEMAASYGRQASVQDVPEIQVPLIYYFAEPDEQINATWPEVEAALRQHNKIFEAHFYAAPTTGSTTTVRSTTMRRWPQWHGNGPLAASSDALRSTPSGRSGRCSENRAPVRLSSGRSSVKP